MAWINNFSDGIVKKTQFDFLCDNQEVSVVVSYNTLDSLLEITVEDENKGYFYYKKHGNLKSIKLLPYHLHYTPMNIKFEIGFNNANTKAKKAFTLTV